MNIESQPQTQNKGLFSVKVMVRTKPQAQTDWEWGKSNAISHG
ncbi:3511_t:CDS:2 [Paraglomus occultum]|uniref:3511_t:CDS:1 n=1 Tax=Paraglomus occultum TaxID=144539 RepID=A0A9N9F4I8_9GLOM|nr:3511_t:CDS:2 [Paraglomus occultum]